MQMISKEQIYIFNTLLTKHGLQDDKREIISSISGGRTESTLQLTWWETQQWINAMNKQGGKPAGNRPNDPRQRMINSIVAMAREMNMVKRVSVVNERGTVEAKSDYRQLNEWMMQKSYLKKMLRQYSYSELPKLVSQFKALYASWMKRF